MSSVHSLAHPVQLLMLVQLDEPVKPGLERDLAAAALATHPHRHHDLLRVRTVAVPVWCSQDKLSIVHGLHVAIVWELDCYRSRHLVIFLTGPPSIKTG